MILSFFILSAERQPCADLFRAPRKRLGTMALLASECLFFLYPAKHSSVCITLAIAGNEKCRLLTSSISYAGPMQKKVFSGIPK